jgi:hypothetical protein
MVFLRSPFQVFIQTRHIVIQTLLSNFHFQLWYHSFHLINHTFLYQCSHILTMKFARMPIWFDLFTIQKFTSSTLKAVFAEVSINMSPFSLANLSPSSVETYLLASRSHLLPINIITMSGLPFCLTSSNHLVKWLKVSRLF